MSQYLYVGTHSGVLASGQPVAPTELIDAKRIDTDDPHDAALIEDGVLVPHTPKAKTKKPQSGEEE
jgi:hypothetical protein